MMWLVLPRPCPAQRLPCDTRMLKQQLPCKNSCPQKYCIQQNLAPPKTSECERACIHEHAARPCPPGLQQTGLCPTSPRSHIIACPFCIISAIVRFHLAPSHAILIVSSADVHPV